MISTRVATVLVCSLVLPAGVALPAPVARVDHSAFDRLLRDNVRNGLVDYDAFGKSEAFRAYLASLAQVDVAALDTAERLAFWINVYNAFTIRLINVHEERDSIRNIKKTALAIKGHGPWRERLVKAGGRQLHLDNVEHDIIRKDFKEPRIHFALVCAALSCPPLRAEAYSGAALDRQLDDQAQEFMLRSPAKNRIDVARGIAHFSPIMASYYRGDFGGSDAAIARTLAAYYPLGPERSLLESGKARIEATDYDWTLNRQAKAAEKR